MTTNLVLNRTSIYEIEDIEKNYIESDMIREFCNSNLVNWLRDQMEDEMADAISKIKEGKNLTSKILKILGLDEDKCKDTQRRIAAEKKAAAETAKRIEKRKAETDAKSKSRLETLEAQAEACVEPEDSSGAEVSASHEESSPIETLEAQANNGDVDAMEKLMLCYDQQENYCEAAKWCRMIAEAYECGNGVKRSHKKAMKWYRRAAGDEEDYKAYADAKAMAFLGGFYYNGKGVEQDNETAMRWYKKAAAYKSSVGAYCVGMCYFSNEGLDYDDDYDCIDDDEARLKKALSNFSRADSWGYPEAREMVREVKQALKEIRNQQRAYQEAVQRNQIRRAVDPAYAAEQDLENGDLFGAALNGIKAAGKFIFG